jgi:hypothetical protein
MLLRTRVMTGIQNNSPVMNRQESLDSLVFGTSKFLLTVLGDSPMYCIHHQGVETYPMVNILWEQFLSGEFSGKSIAIMNSSPNFYEIQNPHDWWGSERKKLRRNTRDTVSLSLLTAVIHLDIDWWEN